MGYLLKPALVLSFLVLTIPLGQAQEPANPLQAEVRFGDGSLVRMTILQESIDVMTKYGKLCVPLRDIRRIDFGLHLPEGVEPQITEAIKLMGSQAYRQREDAARDLVKLGHWAFPSVQKAAQSADLEVSQRAQGILKRIGEKVPADQLRTKLDDSIQTVEFPVTGRIVTSTVKARSTHFGDVTLKLSDLRSLHVRSGSGEAEFVVDAAKYGSAVDQWMDTGVMVDPSLRLVVHGAGQVDLWPQGPGQYLTGPKGYSTPGKGGTHMAGSLLGRVGDAGKVFLVGERYEGVPGEEGKVFLHIVPSPWNNASTGNYKVKIATDHVALTGR